MLPATVSTAQLLDELIHVVAYTGPSNYLQRAELRGALTWEHRLENRGAHVARRDRKGQACRCDDYHKEAVRGPRPQLPKQMPSTPGHCMASGLYHGICLQS